MTGLCPRSFAGPESDERLAALRSVAAEVGATPNQVLIAWMLRNEILPLFGGSRVEQLEENLGAVDVQLSDDQMDVLNTAGNPDVKKAWLR